MSESILTNPELKVKLQQNIEILQDSVSEYLNLLKNKYKLIDKNTENIESLKRIIDNMFGVINYIGAFDFETNSPSQTAFTEQAKALMNNPLYEPKVGDTVINRYDSSD
jgi:hypothetical protein